MIISIASGKAPAFIRRRHPYHEFADLSSDGWATWTSPLAAVVLPGDELPMPPQDRIGRHQRPDLTKYSPAQCLASLRMRNCGTQSGGQLTRQGGQDALDELLPLATRRSGGRNRRVRRLSGLHSASRALLPGVRSPYGSGVIAARGQPRKGPRAP